MLQVEDTQATGLIDECNILSKRSLYPYRECIQLLAQLKVYLCDFFFLTLSRKNVTVFIVFTICFSVFF